MSHSEDIPLGPRLRTMQIVAGAMVFGVIAFLGFALFMVLGQQGGQGLMGGRDGLPMLSLITLGVLAFNIPLALMLPGVQIRSCLQKICDGSWRPPPGANPADFDSDAAKLLVLRQSTLITTLALLEGTAILGCVAFLLEGQLFALAAIGVALVLMLANFPTESGVRSFLQRQAEQLAEMRLGVTPETK